VFQIVSVTPQGLSVLCAVPWEEHVSVSQTLLGGDVIAVRQEPLVLALKVAEVRKIKVLCLICHVFEECINSINGAGVEVSLCLVCKLVSSAQCNNA
jgi:hypothetical protein